MDIAPTEAGREGIASGTTNHRRWPGLLGPAVIAVMSTIMLVFVAHRFALDIPHVAQSTVPDDDFDRRYVEHAWPAYIHIALAVPYLLGAPLQLSRRFRTKHYTFHRRLGRFLLVLALVNTVSAIVFGVRFAYGGATESTASVLFGTWFMFCLVVAFRSIRANDVIRHRRWMIRAYAVAMGVASIRIFLGIFAATGLIDFAEDFRAGFAVAFSLGLTFHVLGGELWVRTTRHPGG